jgi:hypothetical protein
MAVADGETVARFVLRARRIEAHSLVQDREHFAELLVETVTVQLAVDGSATLSRSLLADEETFESLAARVRPLIVEKEPIFYQKVLDAVGRLMTAGSSATAEQRGRLDELSAAWAATALGQHVQAYAMQGANADGSESPGSVSDTLLAAGWMYADLVHADALGWKEKALAFSFAERYAAAVSVFSRIAALAVVTLRFVEQLQGGGVVAVDPEVWETDVVVNATEIRYEGTVFIAAPGADMPALPEPIVRPGGPWTRLTITEHLRATPINQVRAELVGADGSVLAVHDGGVIHRSLDQDVLNWHVLVADSLIFQIQLRVAGDSATPLSMTATLAAEDRRTLLRADTLLLQLHDARVLRLRAQDDVLLEWTPDDQPEDALVRLRATTELLDDLVTLEDLTGQPIGAFTREVTLFERVRLRQTRLLRQGRVVQWDRALPPLVSPDGVTPAAIKIEPTILPVAGAQVATPEVLIGHAAATWHDDGLVSDAAPGARRFTATLPTGTRFLAWCPSEDSTSTGTLPAEGEPWDIAGVDQEACTF